MPRARSNAMSGPASPMVRLDDDLHGLLVANQMAGMDRAVNLLAGLDYDWKELAFSAVKAGANIGLAARSTFGGSDSSGPTTAAQRMTAEDTSASADVAKNTLMVFLEKCFQKAVEKMNNNIWLQRLSEVLQMGVGAVLGWVKSIVLGADLIKQLVPGYSAVAGLIQTGLKAWGTYQHHSVLSNLRDAGDFVGGGVPTVAMDGFQRFVTAERLRAGAHTVYTFAKTLANVLLTIFAAPAASVVGFVTSVVEAIESFVYSAFQAFSFHRATEKARELREQKTLPGAEEFQIITAASPFAGCVFFAASQYIGGFNLTSLLTNQNRVISQSSLSTALTKIDETRKAACGYVDAMSFGIKYHSSADQPQMGHVLQMIKGYANDAPKSELLSDNATTKDKFRHHSRRFARRAGGILKKIVG